MDRLLTRTTVPLVLTVAGVAAAGTAWLGLMSGTLAHPHDTAWSGRTLLTAVVMWQTMMVAMMTPTVAPWVGAYARLVGAGTRSQLTAPLSFASGYFAIWLVYCVGAALMQLAASSAGLLGHGRASPLAASALLIGAGAFQFAPARQACLTHCRNPLSYLLSRWVNGPIGGFRLGATHGAYCVGCCWLLMLTGFALGLTNLAWMAALTVVISLEQGMRTGVGLGRLFGAALIAWGLVRLWPA